MRKPSVLQLLLIMLLSLALITACSDDDDGPTDPGGGGDDGPIENVGTISGVVTDASGWSLDATVTVGSRSVDTNEDGFFVLTQIPVGETLVGASASGHAATYRVVTVTESGTVHLDDLQLAALESGVVDAATGGQVATGDGDGAVTFAADGFVDAAGDPYAGEVTVQLNAMLPEDSGFYGTFPGEFAGIREGGEEVPFVSYGFMTVELTGVDKSPVQLADGVTAELNLTISADKAATAPATIPMWWFDEAAGVWREEGAAILEGNTYSADVAHFTTWNWDLPIEDICSITGTIEDEAGQPVANARVVSRGVDQAIMDEVRSDATGNFTVRAVRNSITDVWAISGSLSSEPQRVTVAEDCPVTLPDPLVLTVPAYSISLTWGESPSDLDSHLLIPMTWDADYDYYHIYFSSMGSLGEDPYAMLDTDDTSSFGPEIITGSRLYDGRFQYWVHNWSGDDSAAIQSSGAVVQLEIGGQLYAYEAVDVSLEGADTTGWWHVFDIVVSGSSVTVERVMQFQPEFGYEGIYADKAFGAATK